MNMQFESDVNQNVFVLFNKRPPALKTQGVISFRDFYWIFLLWASHRTNGACDATFTSDFEVNQTIFKVIAYE